MTLEAMYETMSTETLLELRGAFEYDRAHGAESEFCEGRLKLIAAALEKRTESSSK